MIRIRKSEDRGPTNIGWLDSKHSFSFGHYRDNNHMGFGALRVINEDKVKAGMGFGKHPHSDMEIISYVLEGVLEHKDSLGTGSMIVAGDVQRMSAGTGITHSEANPLDDKEVHFLQIWIMPEKDDLTPGYEQKNFTGKRAAGKLTLVGSPDGREGSLTIHQDVLMYVLDLDAGGSLDYLLEEGRMVWVQVARGNATLNGMLLKQGDGAAIAQEKLLTFKVDGKAEVLIFDLNSSITFN
jgi:redox-sensitive bicupin YhaK (pirin superfamily)